jgi:SAM-dependent methyltransferase
MGRKAFWKLRIVNMESRTGRHDAFIPGHARIMNRTFRRVAAVLALCWISLLSACGESGQPVGSRFPAPERPVAPIISPEFLNEETRDAENEAKRVMDRLGIAPGVRVADIGAGHGYYTVRLARRLGPSATIYAEDIKAEYLKDLESRLEREKIGTVKLILGTAGDPKLARASIDVAILAYVYHEVANPFELLYRLRPALAPNARVGIIDTTRPTQAHGTPPSLLRCELEAVGYRQVDFLWLGPTERYLAVFVPPDALPTPESITPCKP